MLFAYPTEDGKDYVLRRRPRFAPSGRLTLSKSVRPADGTHATLKELQAAMRFVNRQISKGELSMEDVEIVPDEPTVAARSAPHATKHQFGFDDLSKVCTRTTYVCGLYFSKDCSQVALIRKRRPTWQEGRLNGPGGHDVPGESPFDAMVRNFKEETSADCRTWQPLAILRARTWQVHFFRARGSFDGLKTVTDEKVCVRTTALVIQDPTLVGNLRWLIPLAMDDSGVERPVEAWDAR